MKPFLFFLVSVLLVAPASATVTQRNITGKNPEEVKENAYKRGFAYPVTIMKCSQRCSQWWETD